MKKRSLSRPNFDSFFDVYDSDYSFRQWNDGIKPLTLSCIANIPPQLDYPVHLVSSPMPVTSITQGVHVPFNGNIQVGVQLPSLGMPIPGQPPVPGMNYWNLGNQISQ